MELFTDNIFNTFVKKEEELPIAPSTLSATHPKAKNDSDFLFSTFSNNNSLPSSKSTKICHELTKHELVAQYIALGSITPNKIREPLNYKKTIQLSEAYL